MPLADAQAALRDAIVANRAGSVLPLLTGGRDPRHRLSIHRRHYEQSIVDLFRKRFPALDWLVGESFLTAAAVDFARARPPRRPALGEYGEDFPIFLSARPGAESMPWLAEVGALEWTLADVAASVSARAVAIDALAAFEAAPLEALRLRSQPGNVYRAFAWPVDELVRLHLEGTAPDSLQFEPVRVFLEVSGERGAFGMRRLDAATFAFRHALAAGNSLAAALAATANADFDPGAALASLFAEGVVTSVVAIEGQTA